jgi:hypothetical protein
MSDMSGTAGTSGSTAYIAFASLLLCLLARSAALADPPGAGTTVAGTPSTVTIEAQRRREQLRREVDQFVEATIARPRTDDSLLRWDGAVCPLVAGLTREQGEFVLARLSTIARAANAPLAGETCAANLFVIVARNPSGFLWLWWQHDRRLFNTNHGIGGVRRFIETDRPVRVWYNYMPVDADSGSQISMLLAQSIGVAVGTGQGGGTLEYPVLQRPETGSRLRYNAVRAIASVIVVIDAQKVADLDLSRLADYVSLRGLAEINPEADTGGAPTILNLFRGTGSSSPPGLSAWDRALLRAVYRTPQKERRQLSEIETATLDQIVADAAH